jgi:type I restriction enzyme M protein
VFDYMLSNPPFGVEWKQSEKAVRKEYDEQGFNEVVTELISR